jgi:hypothetical protein
MHSACTDSTVALPLDLTGELPLWPEPPTATFLNCSGSAGVTKCLLDNPGAIGYIDTGHGLDAGLSEVRLQSTTDPAIFFHSHESTPIVEAITADVLPMTATSDFSNVTFLNQRTTPMTWPLILMTYIYVRTDLPSYLLQPYEQTLLIAFLRTFFNADYVDVCSKLYGFTLMKDIPAMKAYGEAAITIVEQSINATATPPWIFESKTNPIVGAGPYVFSNKRKEILDVTVQDLTTAVMSIETALTERVDSDTVTTMKINILEKQVEEILLEIKKLQTHSHFDTHEESNDNNNGDTTTTSSLSVERFSSEDATHIKAALVLSSLSFVFWCLWIGIYVMRHMNRGSSNTTNVAAATTTTSTLP